MCRQSEAMRKVREAACGLSLVCLLGERGTAASLPRAEADLEKLLTRVDAAVSRSRKGVGG
jgi:hypothetical protein